MMRVIAVAVLMSVGCGETGRSAPDAGAPPGAPLSIRPGAACDAAVSYFCDDYVAVCAHAVCRSQCYELALGVAGPACPVGLHRVQEVLADSDGDPQCYCVPD